MASSLRIVDLSGQYPGLTKGQLSNGGNPQGLIVHHTGSSDNTTPQAIAAGWARNGLSSQYIMGRDGTIYQMVPDGGKANQIIQSWGAPSTRWANNDTTQGIELIAKDDSDITPVMAASLRQFAMQQSQRYNYVPSTHVLGHGEVNGLGAPPGTPGKYLRQPTEGMTAVNSLRSELSSNAPQAAARTANPLGGPSGLSAADYTNGVPNGSPPPIPAPRSFSIPALPSSSAPPAGVPFAKIISGGGDAPLVVQGTDGNTYTVAGDQNLKYNNPTAMKYDQFAIDHGAIGSASRPGQTPLAVFPSLASGQAAAQQRLFGDNSKYSIPAYKDMTLGQAIKSWAPGGVDGNNDPTSYINGIAKSLGISADTKLSDLSPAQQAQFIAAQAHQEGNKPQVITDGQGHVISGAAPSSIPPGYNTVTDAQRTAMAALPPPPLNAGDSLAFNPISATGNQLPLANTGPAGNIIMPPVLPNSSGGPDERGSQTMPLAPGYNAVTDAQRTAMAALPPPPPLTLAQQAMMTGRGGNVAAPPPIPAMRPAGLGSPPPQMAVLPTGKTIQVGKNYIIGGNQFIGGVNAQGVGTLNKVTSPLAMAAPNTIAGGIAGKAISGALSTAGQNLQQAAGVAGQDLSGALHAGRDAIVGGAQGAVNGVGGFLSGLFGGGGSSPPPLPTVPAGYNVVTPAQRTAMAALPPSYSPSASSSSSNNNSPSFTFPNPPSTPPGYNTVTDAQRTAMAVLPANYSQGPAAPTYQNVTVTNPAYTTWTESYGDALQAAARTANPLGGPNGINPADYTNGAPNPPKPIPPPPPQTITVRRAIAPPPMPSQQSYSPPPVQQVRLASGTMAPVGSISTNAANGYSYRVNADGSTTNITTGHTYGTPTPTNNLATMGAPDTGISDASGGQSAWTPPPAYRTPGDLQPSQLADVAAHGYSYQNGKWVQGAATSPVAAPVTPTPPPVPAPQPGAPPVLSPPRYNGAPGSTGQPQPPDLPQWAHGQPPPTGADQNPWQQGGGLPFNWAHNKGLLGLLYNNMQGQ